MNPLGVGFPDGNPAKSIVVDFKQVFTLTPSSGRVRFALVSGPYGALALQTGVISQSIVLPEYQSATTTGINWVATSAVTAGTGTTDWYIVPFQENADFLIDGETMGAYSIGSYRGLMYTAESTFTGSTMANGGVVTVYKVTPAVTDKPQTTVNTVTVDSKEITNINQGATITSISGRYTGPARTPISLRGVSAKPEYLNVWESTVANEIVPMGRNSSGVLTPSMVHCGFDYRVPITVCDYSGLDASASITVEIRSCLELIPRVGTMAAFAKPSPPAQLSVWEKVANFARSLPAASILRVAGAGATGYVTGGASGALAAMSAQLH